MAFSDLIRGKKEKEKKAKREGEGEGEGEGEDILSKTDLVQFDTIYSIHDDPRLGYFEAQQNRVHLDTGQHNTLFKIFDA